MEFANEFGYFCDKLASVDLGNDGREAFKPLKIERSNLIAELKSCFCTETMFWNSYCFDSMEKVYVVEEICAYSSEYNRVAAQFRRTLKRPIIKIARVENPFLLFQYILEQNKKRIIYGNVLERNLFHGTHDSCISSICVENFNRRKINSFKFGQGVSFARDASYARDYPRRTHGDVIRVMFLVRVLEVNSCIGDYGMKIPPEGYDTSIRSSGEVIVKYEDSEFYPDYIVYYRASQF